MRTALRMASITALFLGLIPLRRRSPRPFNLGNQTAIKLRHKRRQVLYDLLPAAGIANRVLPADHVSSRHRKKKRGLESQAPNHEHGDDVAAPGAYIQTKLRRQVRRRAASQGERPGIAAAGVPHRLECALERRLSRARRDLE